MTCPAALRRRHCCTQRSTTQVETSLGTVAFAELRGFWGFRPSALTEPAWSLVLVSPSEPTVRNCRNGLPQIAFVRPRGIRSPDAAHAQLALEPWTACQRRPGKLVALTAPAQDASPLSLHDVAKPTQLTRTMMQAEVLVEATKSSTKRTRCASPTRCANIRRSH